MHAQDTGIAVFPAPLFASHFHPQLGETLRPCEILIEIAAANARGALHIKGVAN